MFRRIQTDSDAPVPRLSHVTYKAPSQPTRRKMDALNMLIDIEPDVREMVSTILYMCPWEQIN